MHPALEPPRQRLLSLAQRCLKGPAERGRRLRAEHCQRLRQADEDAFVERRARTEGLSAGAREAGHCDKAELGRPGEHRRRDGDAREVSDNLRNARRLRRLDGELQLRDVFGAGAKGPDAVAQRLADPLVVSPKHDRE